MTEWRPIKGFESRYEISDDGKIKVLPASGRGRFNEARILKLNRDTSGYRVVHLYPGGGRPFTARRLSQLLLENFVGPRPPGGLARHLDDDRTNDSLENLAWGTKSSNTYDAVRNGRHNNARKTSCKWGHPLTDENIYRYKGGRFCRICARQRNREYEERQRALKAC